MVEADVEERCEFHKDCSYTAVCLHPKCGKTLLCEKCMELDHKTHETKGLKSFYNTISTATTQNFTRSNIFITENIPPFLESSIDLVKEYSKLTKNHYLGLKTKLNELIDKQMKGKLKQYKEIEEMLKDLLTKRVNLEEELGGNKLEIEGHLTCLNQVLILKTQKLGIFPRMSKKFDAARMSYNDKLENFCIQIESLYKEGTEKQMDNLTKDLKISQMLTPCINLHMEEILEDNNKFKRELSLKIVEFEDLKFDISRMFSQGYTKTKLVFGGYDNKISVFDLTTGQICQVLNVKTSVQAIKRMDQDEFAIGLFNGSIFKYNSETNTKSKAISVHKGTINDIILIYPGVVATASADNLIKHIRLPGGKCLRTLDGHTDMVLTLCKIDDNRMGSGSEDKSIKIWEIQTGKCLRTLQKGHNVGIHTLGLTPQGKLISSGRGDMLRLWNLESGKSSPFIRIQAESHIPCHSFTLLPDGKLIIADKEYLLHVFDSSIKDKTEIGILKGHEYKISAVLGLSENRVATISGDYTLKVWNVWRKEIIQSFKSENWIWALDAT